LLRESSILAGIGERLQLLRPCAWRRWRSARPGGLSRRGPPDDGALQAAAFDVWQCRVELARWALFRLVAVHRRAIFARKADGDGVVVRIFHA